MGQKTNPILLRLNKTNQNFRSCWYSDNDYATQVLQDLRIDAYLKNCSQQLKKIPPVLISKKERGNVQIALFFARPPKWARSRRNRYTNQRNSRGMSFFQHPFSDKKYKEVLHSFPTEERDTKKRQNITTVGGDVHTYTVFLSEKNTGGFFTLFSFLLMQEWKKHSFFSTIAERTTSNIHAFLPGKISKVGMSRMPSRRYNSLIRNDSIIKIKNHLECCISSSTQLKTRIVLIKCLSVHQNAVFIAGQIALLLQERVQFRRIKHRVIDEIRKDGNVRGIRIACSGRVAARSKKAQKARTESVQWGATGLNIFSECLDFSSCFAQTIFGKVGVKVWICYEKKRISMSK